MSSLTLGEDPKYCFITGVRGNLESLAKIDKQTLEQNRELRNRPVYIRTLDLWQKHEGSVFLTSVTQENWIFIWKKKNQPQQISLILIHTIHKNKFQMDFKSKHERYTSKILEYNVRHYFHELTLGRYLSKTQTSILSGQD